MIGWEPSLLAAFMTGFFICLAPWVGPDGPLTKWFYQRFLGVDLDDCREKELAVLKRQLEQKKLKLKQKEEQLEQKAKDLDKWEKVLLAGMQQWRDQVMPSLLR